MMKMKVYTTLKKTDSKVFFEYIYKLLNADFKHKNPLCLRKWGEGVSAFVEDVIESCIISLFFLSWTVSFPSLKSSND